MGNRRDRRAAQRQGEGQSSHPVLAAFLGGQKIALLPWDSLPDSRLIVLAARKYVEALQGKASWEEALACCQAVGDRVAEVPEIRILFLYLWASSAHYAHRGPEADALIRRCQVLVGAKTVLEIRVLVLVLESLVVGRSGNRVGRLALLQQSLELLRPDSPLYPTALLDLALYQAQYGELAASEPRLEALSEGAVLELRSRIAMVRFVDAVETVRLAEAAQFLAQFKADPENANRRQLMVSQYDMLYACLAGRWNRANRRDVVKGVPDSLADFHPVIDSLYWRLPDEAMRHARRLAAEEPEKNIRGLGPDSFDLIRAELASGNGEAARRLLGLRREAGNDHYLDNLFLARVELLAGNHAASAGHFARAVRECDRFRARGRLDFELALSCELSPADLVWLGQQAAGRGHVPAVRTREASSEKGGDLRGVQRLIGRSHALDHLRAEVLRLAPLDAAVLLTGETGTGKGVVSRAIHEAGPRSAKPFVVVNCGAVVDSLLESELFGHEKGAFTGADAAHRGLFEEAGTGTILLDEIGEISPRLQVSLLQVLETGELRPVGSARSRRIHCRIIAATNAELAGLIDRGSFRKDLFYRLARLEIRIPPLRERPEDILPLAEHFLASGRADNARPHLSAELQAVLRRSGWPGNVRELRNLVERMRLLNSEGLAYGLDEYARTQPSGGRPAGPDKPVGAAAPPAALSDVEVEEVFRRGRSPLRRLERLRELFTRYRKLTRGEVIQIMKVSPKTATQDLKALCRANFVEKIRPSASPCSHYFALR